MSERTIIGITGLAGSGKDVVAQYLCHHYGFHYWAFALPLKKMAIELFNWDGVKDEAGRRLLQQVGTDLMRNLWSSGYWVEKTFSQLVSYDSPGRDERVLSKWKDIKMDYDCISPSHWMEVLKLDDLQLANRQSERVVISDCRFPDEAALVKTLGGTVIRVVRPGVQQMDHASEKQEFTVDRTLHNDGSIQDLLDKVDHLLLSI
jgi:hypothetical protein